VKKMLTFSCLAATKGRSMSSCLSGYFTPIVFNHDRHLFQEVVR
jgi:hypothetical protein